MILIIHGENLPRSREIILQLQKKVNSTNKKEVGIEEVTPRELKEMMVSFDIFSEPPFIVLDISDAGRKNVKEYIETLKEIPKESHFVALANKELPSTNAFLKSTKELNAKVVLNRTAPTSNVFRFIESLFSKNRSATYSELRRLLLKDEDPYYLFSMILYELRNITHAKFDSPHLIKMNPFVKNKATKLAKDFSREDIFKLYREFYSIDKDVKTGKISPDLMIPYTVEKVLD